VRYLIERDNPRKKVAERNRLQGEKEREVIKRNWVLNSYGENRGASYQSPMGSRERTANSPASRKFLSKRSEI